MVFNLQLCPLKPKTKFRHSMTMLRMLKTNQEACEMQKACWRIVKSKNIAFQIEIQPKYQIH